MASEAHATPASPDRIETLTFGSWVWNKNTMDGAPATISVTSAGIHTINLWMREDGLYVDRILLTTNASYTPAGNGPAEGLIATPTPTATFTPSATATSTATATASPTPIVVPSQPPTGQVWTQYYYEGSQRVAMRVRDGARNDLYFLLADHLGSTALTVTDTGLPLGEMRYKPWGETRSASGSTPTEYRYTGQREEDTIGLYYYRARWYDPALGRFAQADSIVPGGGSPMAWDRYAYGLDNPVKYLDPTGHRVDEGCGIGPYCQLPLPGSQTNGGKETIRDKTSKAGLHGLVRPRETVITLDTQELANQILPNVSPASLWAFGTHLDELALGIDTLAEAIVLGHVAVGAIGISFEGTPVSGPAGAGAGWILGETNYVTRGLVNAGNVIATLASAASTLADLKAGVSRLSGTASISSSGVDVNYQITVSSTTYMSVSSASLGWAAQVVEFSLMVQAVAVANDLGVVPSWQLSSAGQLGFP